MGDWYRSGLPGSYQYLTPDIDLRNSWKESICFQWDKTGMELWPMDTRMPVQRGCTYLTLSAVGFRRFLWTTDLVLLLERAGLETPWIKPTLSTWTTLISCQTQMRSFRAEVNVKGGFVVSRDIRPLIWDIVSDRTLLSDINSPLLPTLKKLYFDLDIYKCM